ncbi:MAG: hypothetical protein ABUL58_03885, partial [Steroidobacter sp.]
GVTFAFIISNASFYVFAGYFPTMAAWQFTQSVMKYWPGYLLHTAIYAGTGLLIRYIIASMQTSRTSQQASS